MDEHTVSTRQCGFQKYLVQSKDRPDIDSSWLTHEELQQIGPDILERYWSFISPEVNHSQMQGVDEDISPCESSGPTTIGEVLLLFGLRRDVNEPHRPH